MIADEPTTALDVTVQAQVLDLLEELRDHGTAIQFISHSLGVVSQISDRVMVMYAGQVVEIADVNDIFDNPQHPYTQALLDTIPQSVLILNVCQRYRGVFRLLTSGVTIIHSVIDALSFSTIIPSWQAA